MKKLMVLALSMVMSAAVFAHDGDLSDRQNQENRGYWQEMNEIHDVMHNTSISEKRSDNGITFEITANSDSSITSVKKRFVDEKAKLEAYLKGVNVTVNALDSGVEVILESNDEEIAKKLTAYGRSIIYQYLHNGYAGTNGHMGYHRGGYGDRMMRDWGNQNGMNPGMMYEDDSDSQSEPGSYRGYDNHMGYGSGMM